MVEYRLNGREQIIKEVKRQSTSGIIYLPKAWIGHKVAVILDVAEDKE